ncbi:MAG: hypothetical protein ACYCU0_09280 [Solirubrobacteraceae bacterium]
MPVLGDWEGTMSNGYPVSLQLVHDPSLAKRYGGNGYAVEDLSLLTPGVDPNLPGCPYSSPTAEVLDEGLPQPLGAYGAFDLSGSDMSGGLTGPTSATLTAKQRFAASAGFPAECDRAPTAALHPATRHKVDDGVWTLVFPAGESESFKVEGSGRLVSGIGFEPLTSRCGGISGAVNLFIAPEGSASESKPEQFTVALTFTTRTAASGQMSLGSAGACSVPVSAKLTTPASMAPATGAARQVMRPPTTAP